MVCLTLYDIGSKQVSVHWGTQQPAVMQVSSQLQEQEVSEEKEVGINTQVALANCDVCVAALVQTGSAW